MKPTISEIVSKAIVEMRKAQGAIIDLRETGETAVDIEELIININQSMEQLGTIEDIILVALNAAVYAGNIEASREGFIDDFGADSLRHRFEYLAFAEQYDLPYNDDGLIATDCVYNNVSEYMWSTYATEEVNNE